MRMTKMNVVACMAAMTLVASGVPVRLASQSQTANFLHYAITDLGTLGGTFSEADGISSRGALTGFSTLPGDSQIHGFLLENGVMTDLGTLGGQNSVVPEAEPEPNDRSQVVGVSETSTLDPNAENFCSFTGFFSSPNTCVPFIWQDGVMAPLPLLGGNNGTAWQINNRGQATGIAENATFDPACPTPELEAKPVIWEDGRIQELPTIDGDLDGAAQSINDSGQVVGYSGNCTAQFPFTTFHAVLWQHGPGGWTATDLGNLGASALTLAFGINNRGQVVGQAGTPCLNAGGCGLPPPFQDATFHAFLWQNGKMTDLGTLPGDVQSWAETINAKNQAVGTSFDVAGDMHPFIWEDGVMTNLNALIPADSPWFLLEALGGNDRGQIVGFAFNTLTGEVHGYLATPCEGEGCGAGASAAASPARTTRKIVIPEEVRKLLNQRRGLWHRVPVVSQPKD